MENSDNKRGSGAAKAGILVAFTASLCCITPVLALISGVGGVASTFSWMEPLRPFMIALTIGVLGFAWYQKIKPKKQEEIDCDCDPASPAGREDGKEPFIQSKMFLGIVTVVAALLLTFPSYSHIFYPENEAKSAVGITISNIQQLNLEIEGMTCTGCEEHVKHASYELKGVLKAESSYEEGNASVVFDNSKTSIEDVIKAVNATGYTVTKDEIVKPTLNLLESGEQSSSE